MKIKLLVAATMFAIAGQASAMIADGTSGNGELFFSVDDTVNKVSYIRDLGVDMNTFIAHGSMNGYSLNYAADAMLQSYLNTANASGGNLIWNVAAMDSTGVGPGVRYLSTTNASLTTIKTQSNSNLGQFIGANNYVQAMNTLGSSTPGYSTNTNFSQADGSGIASATDGYAFFEKGMGTKWNTKAVFDSTAAIGHSLNFFFLTPSSTAGLAKASVTQFGNVNGNAKWTLNAAGNLSYAAPVPVPAALWLLGSGLVGMVGVARRKAK